jgi:hypothetical protein
MLFKLFTEVCIKQHCKRLINISTVRFVFDVKEMADAEKWLDDWEMYVKTLPLSQQKIF